MINLVRMDYIVLSVILSNQTPSLTAQNIRTNQSIYKCFTTMYWLQYLSPTRLRNQNGVCIADACPNRHTLFVHIITFHIWALLFRLYIAVLSFSIYQPLYTRPAIYFCLLQIILSCMHSSDSMINGRMQVSYLPAQTVWKRHVILYITSGLE